MFEYKRKLLGASVSEMINQIIQGHYDKLDLILHVFGFSPFATYENSQEFKIQMENYKKLKQEILNSQVEEKQADRLDKQSPFWFLQREKYSNSVTDSVLELCLFFIQDFIGEDSYDDLSVSNDSLKNSAKYMNQKSINFSQYSQNDKFNQKQKIMSPLKSQYIKTPNRSQLQQLKKMCILIFDNFSYLEDESWCLLLRVFDTCKNICIISMVSIDHKQQLLMPKFQQIKKSQGPKNQNEIEILYYQDEIDSEKAFQKESKIFDVPSVSSKDLKVILTGLAPDFQQSFSEEIQKMTDIVDPDHTIKTIEQSEEWTRILRHQFNLNKVFTSIDDEIIDLIVSKCDGVALMCMEYFLILLREDFIKINHNNKVVCTSKLDECLKLQNYQSIMVPPSVHKRRLRNMDDFIKGQNNQVNTQKNQDIPIRGVMLMKAAAIIGDEFGTQALIKIMSQRNETNGSIIQILKLLEHHEFIEILDESDPKNLICRFNKSFLRESIYQVMLFREQKQVLHRRYVEHLQSLPISIMDKNLVQIELEKLRNHILIGEDLKDESQLPFKQMQGLIVKQMQSLLVTNDKKQILYKATVYKQGKAANKKISKRLLILYPLEIQWFHNAQEYEQGQTPLGSIKILDIYKTSDTLMQEGRTYDFDIHFSQCVKKGQLELQPSFINFGCLTENDRSHWISRIEFLRAKIIYEEYVNKYVNIQFPLKKLDQQNDDSSQLQNDQIFEQLSFFGKNLKQNTKINTKIIQKYFYTSNKKQVPKNQYGMAAQNSFVPRHSFLSNPTMLKSQNSNIVEEFNISENFTINQIQSNLNNPQELSKKLVQLYRASIVCFVGQTQANANKQQYQNTKNKPLGFLPNYFKLENIDIIESPQKQMSIKTSNQTIENINYQVSNNQKINLSNLQESALLRNIQKNNQIVLEKRNTQDQMNQIQETSEGESSLKSRQLNQNSAQNLRSPKIYSRKSKDQTETNLNTFLLQTNQKKQYQQKQIQLNNLKETANTAKRQSRLSVKNTNPIKDTNTNFNQISQEGSVDSANQVSVQLKMLEGQKKTESQINKQRFSIEMKDNQFQHIPIQQQNQYILDKERNFTFSDKKQPFQETQKFDIQKQFQKGEWKNVFDKNVNSQESNQQSLQKQQTKALNNNNIKFTNNPNQQDSLPNQRIQAPIKDIRAIQDIQNQNAKNKYENQELQLLMSNEKFNNFQKLEQIQQDNSFLQSNMKEDLLELEINKRVNKSLNKFFLNLNNHLDSSKQLLKENIDGNESNSYFNNLVISAINTTVTDNNQNERNIINSNNQLRMQNNLLGQIEVQNMFRNQKISQKEEGMLKNNIMSQTNSVQSKQKPKIGYNSNISKEIVPYSVESDDSLVEDPEISSPSRNQSNLVLNNQKLLQEQNNQARNVTPLKSRRMQKGQIRERNDKN